MKGTITRMGIMEVDGETLAGLFVEVEEASLNQTIERNKRVQVIDVDHTHSLSKPDKAMIAEMFAVILQNQCCILNIQNGKKSHAFPAMEAMLEKYGPEFDGLLDKVIEWRDGDD